MRAGFTLIELLVAMTIVGVVFLGLYSGMTYGFTTVQFTRENLRATQILVEKMETIRLYSWDQLNDNNFIPNTFSATYYPPGVGTGKGGVVYSGKLQIEDADLTTNYKDSVKRVTVTLDWNTGKTPRTRSLSSFVAEGGLHNYVY